MQIKVYLHMSADQQVCHLFLRETSGRIVRLREKLDEVNWTVGVVNHTVTNDISVHQLKIQNLQVTAHYSKNKCSLNNTCSLITNPF